MRATSERRRSGHRSRYTGAPGVPAEHRRHDYAGDGPAFICERCGARVSAVRPRHAWGGGKSSPWAVCADDLPVAQGNALLPTVTKREARERGLVSRTQIAKRFGVVPASVARLRFLPAPVARRMEPGVSGSCVVFDAIEVELAVRNERPSWVRRTAKAAS